MNTESVSRNNRLDALSLKELKYLFLRSQWLVGIGVLFLIGGILLTLSVVSPKADHSSIDFWLRVVNVVMLVPYIYVWLKLRNKAARIFFYFWSATYAVEMLLLATMTLCRTPLSPVTIAIGLIVIIGLCIYRYIFQAARSNYLFGPGYFSHKQIKYALVKKIRNESFTDEDLPAHGTPNKKFGVICIVMAYILHVDSMILLYLQIMNIYS